MKSFDGKIVFTQHEFERRLRAGRNCISIFFHLNSFILRRDDDVDDGSCRCNHFQYRESNAGKKNKNEMMKTNFETFAK